VSTSEYHGYTLGDLFAALKRRRLIVLAVTLACVCATAAYAWLARPVYRSEVVLAPVKREPSEGGLAALAGQFGGVASLAGINIGGDNQTDETLAILKSNAFLSQFLQERQLLPILFASRWDESRKSWRDPADVPSLGDGLKKWRSEVFSVSIDEGGSLVRVRIDWHDPTVAADWANDIVARLNKVTRLEAIARAERSIGFLNKELQKQPVIEVQQAVYRLLESQIKGTMIASVDVDYAMRVIDPAIPADRDKFVRPKRWLLLVLSLLGGLALGCAVAVVLDARRRSVPSREG